MTPPQPDHDRHRRHRGEGHHHPHGHCHRRAGAAAWLHRLSNDPAQRAPTRLGGARLRRTGLSAVFHPGGPAGDGPADRAPGQTAAPGRDSATRPGRGAPSLRRVHQHHVDDAAGGDLSPRPRHRRTCHGRPEGGGVGASAEVLFAANAAWLTLAAIGHNLPEPSAGSPPGSTPPPDRPPSGTS